jgi:hypothetical protein
VLHDIAGLFRRIDVPKTKTTLDGGGRPALHLQTAAALRVALSSLIALVWTAGAAAQWPPVTDPKLRGGGVSLEPAQQPVPFDPNGPPIAAFFEAGQNIEGGLPYTPWAKALRDERFALRARDNPDAQCMPMGFLQFHQQPQPRMIIQTEKMILIEYEANYGIRHIYLDGRELPPQGEPQPWWYGYSVGHWEGDDLVVETNNLRGADEDSPYDGWLDVNGSPHSRQAKITERFRRPTLGHLQIDFTIEDPKAYTKPWTVRIDQRLLPDQELIEFVCNENQQFGSRIQLNQEPASEPSSTR